MMPNNKPISAAVLVCETVLAEKTGGPSAIRIMDALWIGQFSPAIRFFVLTYLHCTPGDFSSHTLKVQMVGRGGDDWAVVAEAKEESFVYGYAIDPSGPGGYMLTTEFTLDPKPLQIPALYFIQALLDGELAVQTPFTLLLNP
jgi:hypothetical protein